MMQMQIRIALAIVILGGAAQAQDAPKGVRLEQHAWPEAERLLTSDAVVVLPLGAALKEHGPHLTLRNDLILAEYFAERITAAAPVVMAPPLTYHFYPAFLEYPGSTSLTLDTARDLTIQVTRSLARFGPRRFYVLNTGISTTRALQPAADALAREGILLRFTDLGASVDRVAARIRQQDGGSHADEIETSMMLYIDPASVDMSRAVKDFSTPTFAPPLTRQPSGRGTYSPTGIWGDPTLATREKGQVIVEGLVSAMLRDIEALRGAALPSPAPVGAAGSGSRTPPSRPTAATGPDDCLPGAERDIKRLEATFNSAWKNRDAEQLGLLWARDGDLVHTDGSIEKGQHTIMQNRREQFKRPEYRDARHVLRFGVIRCVTGGIAIVDGQWDLQDVTDTGGATLPRTEGFMTLVLQRAAAGWEIEAYRYHTKPGSPPPPLFQKRPGFPDKR